MSGEIFPESALVAEFPNIFLRILAYDIVLSSRRMAADDSQAARRDFVRTVFAAIEGWLWEYKQIVEGTIRDVRDITPSEAAALSELRYTISDTGKLREQARSFPLATMFRFVTRLVEDEFGHQIVDFSSPEWLNFQQATLIRNRVTHPKNIEDLHLTDHDISIIQSSHLWLLEMLSRIGEKSLMILKSHMTAMREIFAVLKDGDPALLELYNRVLDDAK